MSSPSMERERKTTFASVSLSTSTGSLKLPIQNSTSQTSAPTWKDGLLCKREKGLIKATWKDRYVILLEGSLFWYQHASDFTPKGVYNLIKCQISDGEKKSKRKNTFCLYTPDEEVLFEAEDQPSQQAWIEAITRNLSKPASPPPDKEFIKKTKAASLHVSGKIVDVMASLGVPSKFIKEYVSDDTLAIIEAVKRFIVAKTNVERASKMEKQALSITVKILLLYKEKKLNKEFFESAKGPIRGVASKVIDGYEIPFSFNALELIDSIREVQQIVSQILKPFVHEKTYNKMNALFDFICNEDLIEDFFTKKKWRECEQVGTSLRRLWDLGSF